MEIQELDEKLTELCRRSLEADRRGDRETARKLAQKAGEIAILLAALKRGVGSNLWPGASSDAPGHHTQEEKHGLRS